MSSKERVYRFLRDIEEARDMLSAAESILDGYSYTENMARSVETLVEQLRGINIGVRIMQDEWMQEETEKDAGE